MKKLYKLIMEKAGKAKDDLSVYAFCCCFLALGLSLLSYRPAISILLILFALFIGGVYGMSKYNGKR